MPGSSAKEVSASAIAHACYVQVLRGEDIVSTALSPPAFRIRSGHTFRGKTIVWVFGEWCRKRLVLRRTRSVRFDIQITD